MVLQYFYAFPTRRSSDLEYNQDVDFEDVYQYDPRGFEDEEALLTSLIEKAEDCIQTETDAKAEALHDKYLELQQENNNPELKIIVFTEFRKIGRASCRERG